MMNDPFGGSDFMFSVIPVIIGIGFVVILIIVILQAVRGVGEWSKNNHSPVLTVSAQIVAKRMQVNRTGNLTGENMNTNQNITTYYVTFQVESGDRIALKVPDQAYGLLVEGDTGQLTFQGTRYKGFERRI